MLPSPWSWTAGDDATAARMQSLTTGILFNLGGAAGRKPTFAAYNATGPSVATGTYTSLKMDTILEDTDSAYNASTGIYTAVTPGFYLFVATTKWATSTAGARFILINSTGSLTAAVDDVTAGSDGLGRVGATIITRLAVGQTVSLQAYQSSGGALSLTAGAGATTMAGFLVAA